MTSLHIEDEEVKDIAGNAARVACKTLDVVFKGKDRGGITSNFEGLLSKLILEMLGGRDPRTVRAMSSVHLPALVHTDATFGDPIGKSDDSGFVVVRESDWWVLGWDGVRFVSGRDEDTNDPFTSFAAAVAGAMKYLQKIGSDAKTEGIRVVSHAEWKKSLQARS
jgi:hypothetical protein